MTGRLTVEGESPGIGSLRLTPMTGGSRAFAMVAEDGAFQLRTTEGSGAMPGAYRVSFKHKPTGKLRGFVREKLAGSAVPIDQVEVTYQSPEGFSFDIPEAGSRDVDLQISEADGWTPILGN